MPALGRPRAFDREAALQSAMLLFWRKGFLATSMNDLCEAMGIRSPSLYAAFGSKESLYIEAVDYYVEKVRPSVWDHLSRGATARAGMEGLLLAAARQMPACDVGPGGCMVTLAAIGEEYPGGLPDAARKARLDGLEQLRPRLRAAIVEGELPASTDVDRLSRFYLSVFQGIVIQARDGATPTELEGIVEMAMAAWPAP
jgi:AcrR family transcriptional regulator